MLGFGRPLGRLGFALLASAHPWHSLHRFASTHAATLPERLASTNRSQLNVYRSGLFKRQRVLDVVAFFYRLLQLFQHKVIGARFEFDTRTGLDLQPPGECCATFGDAFGKIALTLRRQRCTGLRFPLRCPVDQNGWARDR